MIPGLPSSASRTHVESQPRDSTSVLEPLPVKLDIKRHLPNIFYLSCTESFVCNDIASYDLVRTLETVLESPMFTRCLSMCNKETLFNSILITPEIWMVPVLQESPIYWYLQKKPTVSEYDQEFPQSHIADQLMAPRGGDTEHHWLHDIKRQ